ncbi:VIT1/CCC1 transporter family protein, partial [Roseiarcus sp.]|uniref:VIT1/CCC1 transporter family protein n=1 Tax=Roseiarcus sp. TaxID=1969460 RepID=UPI003F97B9FE
MTDASLMAIEIPKPCPGTQETLIAAVSIATLVFLVELGALCGWLGGATLIQPALRVGFWGAIATAVTAGLGA